jgi:hypothetical protein
MIVFKYKTAGQIRQFGPFLDDTDFKTPETGLTIANTDIQIYKNGATTGANKNSGGATHIADGNYYATFNATDTDTLGDGYIDIQVAGALPVKRYFVVLTEDQYERYIKGKGLFNFKEVRY